MILSVGGWWRPLLAILSPRLWRRIDFALRLGEKYHEFLTDSRRSSGIIPGRIAVFDVAVLSVEKAIQMALEAPKTRKEIHGEARVSDAIV